MAGTLGPAARDRLDRSCSRRPDSISFGPSAPGIDRAEVRLSRYAFAAHRHGTYAIGVTTAGVQTFRYRGERRVCLPGQLHVLHPDEAHDGAAGTDDGFSYRILYIEPELVRDALDGRALPFVADPVRQPNEVTAPVVALLADVAGPLGELDSVDLAVAVAETLHLLAGRPDLHPSVDTAAVISARDYLRAHARERTPAATLERVAGTDRYTLARHFRRAYGTSPGRYRTLRRLALARRAIERGAPLARAAADTGFADQSHLTRQFKRAYGFTPSRWAALTITGRGSP